MLFLIEITFDWSDFNMDNQESPAGLDPLHAEGELLLLPLPVSTKRQTQIYVFQYKIILTCVKIQELTTPFIKEKYFVTTF